MLDTFGKKSYYHLLIDQETFGVLASVDSISVLQALSSGIDNSSVMNVTLPAINLKLKTLETKNYILGRKSNQSLIPSEGNVAKSLKTTSSDSLFDVIEMTNPTAEFIKKKTLSIMRAHALIIIEQKIERYLVRAKYFCGDEILIPYLAEELKNNQSLAIAEWARIVGIPEADARKDIEIKVKAAQIITLRLNAVWTKYVNRVNSLNDQSSIDQCIKYDLEIELRSGVQ